jgi:hypothetical protein
MIIDERWRAEEDVIRSDKPERPVWQDRQQPKCSDCDETENLTPYTVAGKHKHICRRHLRDLELEGDGPA